MVLSARLHPRLKQARDMDLAAAAKFHDPYDTNALFKESDVHLFATESQ